MEDGNVDWDAADNVDSFLDEPILSLDGGVTTIEEDADNKSPESQKGHFRKTVSAKSLEAQKGHFMRTVSTILNKLCPTNVGRFPRKIREQTSYLFLNYFEI